MKNILLVCLLLLGVFPLTAQQRPFAKEFDVRAFYVDCRTEVLTIGALNALAEDLSKKGINAILMEWEATFPFDKHATLCNQYAFTETQVRDFVAHCARLGIDVIPLQNCFGHSEYILRHDRYAALREDAKEVSQVCPLKIPQSTAVFSEIFAEVARLHPSKYFHIGADETYLLGSCKECAAVAEKEGKSRLFVDYVKAMSEIVLKMGKIPVIWADIILKYPEAVTELPKELIFVDWNYGWEPDRFGKLQNLFDAGVKMWGATALRSGPDNLYLTQWEKHFNNLATFIPFARRNGYTGMVQTSWSTSGTYGFHYDMGYEVLDMQPVRLVYPTSGFNVLLDAYCKAVNAAEPLDPRAFVTDYAVARYGFDVAQAEILWDYFRMPQEPVNLRSGEAGKKIAGALEACLALKQRLDGLKPARNKQEFAHYALMLDLRIEYLRYKQVEAAYESPSYDRGQTAVLAAQLKPVVDGSAKLDSRFKELNKGYLQEGEIAYLNDMRKKKMLALYGWLVNKQ